MNKFYTKIERQDGTFSIIKSDGKDNFVSSLLSLVLANIVTKTDTVTKLNLKKQPIALTYDETMKLKDYHALKYQVPRKYQSSEKSRADADDFAYTLKKANISNEDKIEFKDMLKDWSLCYPTDYVNNAINWLDDLVKKYKPEGDITNLEHLRDIMDKHDRQDTEADMFEFKNAMSDVFGRPNAQGYILRTLNETYSSIASDIYNAIAHWSLNDTQFINICKMVLDEFSHSPLSCMSSVRSALENLKCDDKILMPKLKELDRITRDNDNYEILTRLCDEIRHFLGVKLLEEKDKAMTTKTELYEGFNKKTAESAIILIRDYGHCSGKCNALHHTNNGALRLNFLARELKKTNVKEVPELIAELCRDIGRFVSEKEMNCNQMLINGTKEGIYILADDIMKIEPAEFDRDVRKFMAIRPRWDAEEMVVKIVKDMRRQWSSSDIIKKQFDKLGEDYYQYTDEIDIFNLLNKWANTLNKTTSIQLYDFIDAYCADEDFPQDFREALRADLSVNELRDWFIACTQQGKDVACASAWCNEGNGCDNCVHTAGRKCFGTEIYDFNPDDCDKCPIASLPCGLCEAMRDEKNEYDLQRKEQEEHFKY
jgi:hypothetical protein